MPGLADVYGALQKAVLDRFAAVRGTDPGSAFVAFEYGTPVPDDTFRLDDPDHTLAPQLAVEFLSTLSNTAPDVSGMLFRRSERTLENQYDLMLNGATPVVAPTIALVEATLTQARDNFDNQSPSFRGPFSFRPVQATPLTWYDSSKSENWSHVRVDLHDAAPPPTHPPVDPGLLKWKIAPEALRAALETPVTTTTFHSLQDAPLETIHGGGSHGSHLGGIGGSRWSHPEGDFQLTVEGTAAAASSTEPEPAPPRKFSPLFDVHAVRDFQAVFEVAGDEQPVVADAFNLDVMMCLVSIARPWLSDGLMTMPGWFVPGFPRGAFASGPPSNTGLLGVLPTACIFIRNLTVRSNWSETDMQVLESSSSFGAFNLLGRKFDRSSLTLEVPGMQAFAWVCEPLPPMPPLAAP